MGKVTGPRTPMAAGKQSAAQTITDSKGAVSRPPSESPQVKPRKASRWEGGDPFESAEIGALHRQQEQFEIDRRRQEQAARDRRLADQD